MRNIKVYTKEWYSRKDKTDRELMLARREYEKLTAQSPECEGLRKQLHFHDSKVEKIALSEDVLGITFDISGAGSTVTWAQFINAYIIANDGISKGDFWLYEELYKISDKYELHILFCDAADNSKELIFTFGDAKFMHDNEKLERQMKIKARYNIQ